MAPIISVAGQVSAVDTCLLTDDLLALWSCAYWDVPRCMPWPVWLGASCPRLGETDVYRTILPDLVDVDDSRRALGSAILSLPVRSNRLDA